MTSPLLSLSAVAEGVVQTIPGAHSFPRLTLALMYRDASPVVKFILTGLFLAALAALVLLAVGMMLPPPARAKAARFLESLMLAAPIAAALGAAYGTVTIFIGIANTNVWNLAVAAPGIAEAILSVATGLATLLIAVIAYAVVRPRPAG
jgi:hypothetical protein